MSLSSGNVLKNFIGPGWHTSGSALFPEKHPGEGGEERWIFWSPQVILKFAKSLCPALNKRISSYLAEVLRFGIAGWFVAPRKMFAENLNRASAGFQEKEFGLQKNSS
jgi:hypothetical protein